MNTIMKKEITISFSASEIALLPSILHCIDNTDFLWTHIIPDCTTEEKIDKVISSSTGIKTKVRNGMMHATRT